MIAASNLTKKRGSALIVPNMPEGFQQAFKIAVPDDMARMACACFALLCGKGTVSPGYLPRQLKIKYFHNKRQNRQQNEITRMAACTGRSATDVQKLMCVYIGQDTTPLS